MFPEVTSFTLLWTLLLGREIRYLFPHEPVYSNFFQCVWVYFLFSSEGRKIDAEMDGGCQNPLKENSGFISFTLIVFL